MKTTGKRDEMHKPNFIVGFAYLLGASREANNREGRAMTLRRRRETVENDFD